MTLDTQIYVRGQVSHLEVFAKCNQLIGADEGTLFTDREGWPGEGSRTLMNEPGQGLPGWLILHYRADGPYRAETEPHDEDCEPGCTSQHEPACWLNVSLDTAYSYHGPDGGCGDLHARVVAELGHWLDERGIPWSWKNEFTGEIHERYAGLTELGGGGAEASDWFRSIVAPVIASAVLTDDLP
jgi:hypothetical protein